MRRALSYTLDTVFSFGDGFGEPWFRMIDAIETEILLGNVTMEEVKLPSQGVGDLNLFSGRTHAHRHLCSLAAAWLESRGLRWTVNLQKLRYPGGGLADVVDEDEKIFVECGQTKVHKTLGALGDKLEVLVCPYSEGPPLGFWFKPVNDLKYDQDILAAAEKAIRNLDLP